MNEKPKTKRRLFRFSLRTLLVFVTIASAGFGWLGVKVRQAQRQKEAVEAIQKLGGWVLYDYQRKPQGGFNLSATPSGPAWLRKFLGDDFFATITAVSLKSLTYTRAQVTDADLVHLRSLTQLEYVALDFTEVTDAGLVHLYGLSRLKMLSLRDTKVTDEGCQKLWKALPNLKFSR